MAISKGVQLMVKEQWFLVMEIHILANFNLEWWKEWAVIINMDQYSIKTIKEPWESKNSNREEICLIISISKYYQILLTHYSNIISQLVLFILKGRKKTQNCSNNLMWILKYKIKTKILSNKKMNKHSRNTKRKTRHFI